MTHLYIRQTLNPANLTELANTQGINPGFVAWVDGYGPYIAAPPGTFITADGIHIVNGYLGVVQWADYASAIDGYQVKLVYNPVNYTAPIDNIIGEHIARIDKELGDIIAGTIDGYTLSFVYSPVNYVAPIDNILGEHISKIDQQLGAILPHTRLLGVGTEISAPAGFSAADRAACTISYVDGTRTFTIAPVSGSFSFWANGTKYTKNSPISISWPFIEGIHYFYFDQNGNLQTTIFPSDMEPVYQGVGASIATVYWDTDNLIVNMFTDERHGFMPQDVQLPWHLVFGSQWITGGGFNNLNLGDGSLDGYSQFGINNVRISDQDIISWINNGSPEALDPILNAQVFYRNGPNGNWRAKTADGYVFIQSGSAGYTGPNGRIAYNNYNGSNWTLTEADQDNYVIVFICATNSPNTPVVSVLGQHEYANVSDARNAVSIEAATITDPSISFAALVALGAVIYQTNSTYGSNVKARLVAVDFTGSAWVDLRGTRGGVVSSAGSSIALSTIAPVNVDKSTALTGTSEEAARSDHKHDISTAIASGLSVGGSSTEGTASTLARSDHEHGLPAFGTGAGTIAQGNDSRFSDARTPLAHASTHVSGGSDAIDGYHLSLNYIPINYLTPVDFIIGEQISGIDQKFGSIATSISNIHLDGYVVGPASSTDSAIALFNGTTGKLIKNSAATMDGYGNITAGTYNGVTVQTHATRHQNGGADQIDGYNIAISYTPTNYINPSPAVIGEHFYRIDQKLGVLSNAGYVVGPASSTDTAIARYSGTTGKLIQNSSATMDGYGNITAGTYNSVTVENHHVRHQNGGADQIDGYNVVLSYSPTNYIAPIHQIIGEHIYRIDQQLAKRRIIVEFALTEDINNTTEYFYTWRAEGTDTATNGKRSSSTTGLSTTNNCSPFQVPFNATVISAVLTVRGVGVQNGSVTYPVSYQTNLMSVGFTSDSSLGSVNFSISNSFTVGTFSVGNTNFKGSVALNISVNQGDMLGLKFVNGTGASVAGQTRMAFVTFVLEAR